jgi:hypothetical protein
MTIGSASANISSSPVAPSQAPGVRAPAPPSWPWRRAALLLAIAAQLIAISALVSADPIAANWSSLLLAIAPAPLALAAAYAPAPVSKLAAVTGVAALIAGIAGQATQTGATQPDWVFVFFLPALVVLAVGGARLWSERP